MLQYSFENTTLWQSSLARQENDQFHNERERLRSQFFTFRKKVSQLVTRISAQLPNLTLHDISHLDALWEVASLIAGSDYPLNPLEGFILGGAFLLHDAALCFEAFGGGVNEVRATRAWQDAFVAESQRDGERLREEIKKVADFLALRQLHAEQAETLVEREWPYPDSSGSTYLIDDEHLRRHLGKLIGQIASSHHWSIEEVGSRLRQQVNAPGEFPRTWRIDPVKIACLLRCADALHIDNNRAPDFLYALFKQRGISFLHWQAQNWLSHADLDSSDDTAVLITSTCAFPEESSDSWWIAFDAVCVADKEIQASNALLKSRETAQSTSFQVRRTKGTDSPEDMAQYIELRAGILVQPKYMSVILKS